jgi:hypothetical protein
MPMSTAVVRQLNSQFDKDRILYFAKKIKFFALGRPLSAVLVVRAGSALEAAVAAQGRAESPDSHCRRSVDAAIGPNVWSGRGRHD